MEYAKKSWKFGLDLEYDFVILEDSFMLLQNSIDWQDKWSNGHIFQVTSNVSKDFAKGRLAFKLTPFYRYVDYGKRKYYIMEPSDHLLSAEGKEIGSSHEFGIRVGVQF
jgi:hypothetical protein